jgi:hypothetical protein
MDTLTVFCVQPPIWFSYASGFASLFALIFSVLYFLKPNLIISNESENNEIRIKCENKDWFVKVKDIKCDIVASKDDKFGVTDTLDLAKDWISGIQHNGNYIFKTINLPSNFSDKKYIKVRMLADNIIGIKKYYEKIFPISTINKSK